MSKEYLVKWASIAQQGLKQIIDYIALDSPGNALQIQDGISKTYCWIG